MNRKLLALFDGDRLIIFILLLGCVEFAVAAVFNLSIDPDPKNAFLFGYSFSRLALSGLSLFASGWLVLLAWSASIRARVLKGIDAVVQKAPLAAGLVVALLAGLAIIIGVAPFEVLGRWGFFFARARSTLLVLCLYPAQFSILWKWTSKRNSDWGILRPFLVSLVILTALGGFIILSGWGITPEGKYWTPGGIPMTSLQFTLILWIGLLVLGLFGLVKVRLSAKNYKYFDLLVTICLFVGAIYFWMDIPTPHNGFSVKPVAPYFQPFPTSDAATYDLGSLSILKGSGIFFRRSTDKPLYMVFLAFLHSIGGYDYNLLMFLHAGFMALMVPILYFFGKSFHSRMFGFVLAAIILIRQYNSIFLTNRFIYNVNPRQLMTEAPTLIGLIFFSWCLFSWLKRQEVGRWRGFVAGGIIGAVSLIRPNPLFLIAFGPVFLFFSSEKNKKLWISQSLTFLFGCILVIAPWVVTARNPDGVSFYLLKFNGVIKGRYGPAGIIPAKPDFGDKSQVSNDLSKYSGDLTPLNAGITNPPISIESFPGFVINNTLTNFVGTFLTLPDSIGIADQNIDVVIRRPYWAEGIASMAPQQIPFLLLNLAILALGLGWAWYRWKWAGLVPVFVFVVYSLSLGFGRTSGTRYLVPIDWVANFYFALGVVWMFQLMPKSFRNMVEAEDNAIARPNHISEQAPKWKRFSAITLIIFLAALIPMAQSMIPPQAPYCQPGNLKSLEPVLIDQGAPKQFSLVYGNVLYPVIKKDHLAFTLVMCKRSLSYEINGFGGSLTPGQIILAGFTGDDKYPKLDFIALPSVNGGTPQIIWKLP